MKRLNCVLLCLAILGTAGSIRAEYIPVSSELTLKGTATLGNLSSTDTQTASQGATINALAPPMMDAAVMLPPSTIVAAMANGKATWDNPHSGTLDLAGVGFFVMNAAVGSAAPNQGLDFSYAFITDNTGTFDLTYSVTAVSSSLPPNFFGLGGFQYSIVGGSLNDSFAINLNAAGLASGVISSDVDANTLYKITIKNGANIGFTGGDTSFSRSMSGTFDFEGHSDPIRTPEPGSLILGLLGVASFVGLSRYRRKKGA